MLGEVVRKRVERAQGLVTGREVGMTQREHVLGPPEVAEPVAPEIDQLGALREPVDDEVVDATRQQSLAAVADRAQSGAPVQRRAEVVALVEQLCLGRV
jgi:hypothetical protein